MVKPKCNTLTTPWRKRRLISEQLLYSLHWTAEEYRELADSPTWCSHRSLHYLVTGDESGIKIRPRLIMRSDGRKTAERRSRSVCLRNQMRCFVHQSNCCHFVCHQLLQHSVVSIDARASSSSIHAVCSSIRTTVADAATVSFVCFCFIPQSANPTAGFLKEIVSLSAVGRCLHRCV